MKIRRTSFATLLLPMLLLAGCSSSPTPSNSSASGPVASTPSAAQVDLGADPLPSWNKGPAKEAIISFVKATTDKANPHFVQPEDRIATFDQDGTTWVEQPMYSQLLFMRDRLVALAPQHPEWSKKPIFRGLIVGDLGALAKATDKDLQDISDATQVSMPVEEFAGMVKTWMATAKHPRCWCCTMTPSVSMPMALPRGCLIPRSASSRRLCMTRPRPRAGLLSA